MISLIFAFELKTSFKSIWDFKSIWVFEISWRAEVENSFIEIVIPKKRSYLNNPSGLPHNLACLPSGYPGAWTTRGLMCNLCKYILHLVVFPFFLKMCVDSESALTYSVSEPKAFQLIKFTIDLKALYFTTNYKSIIKASLIITLGRCICWNLDYSE